MIQFPIWAHEAPMWIAGNLFDSSSTIGDWDGLGISHVQDSTRSISRESFEQAFSTVAGKYGK